jgi:hypothetical protein
MQTDAIRNGLIAAGIACSAFAVRAPDAQSQSLGEVARQESERRKGTPSTRVYTNDDLTAVVVTAMPPAAAAPPETPPAGESSAVTNQTGPTVMVEDPVTHKVNIKTTATVHEERDEQYWRARSGEVRGKLARATADLEAAQGNLAAIDAAPKTRASAREREIVASLVQRLQSEVYYRQQDVAKLQTYAETSKVPPDWTR